MRFLTYESSNPFIITRLEIIYNIIIMLTSSGQLLDKKIEFTIIQVDLFKLGDAKMSAEKAMTLGSWELK